MASSKCLTVAKRNKDGDVQYVQVSEDEEKTITWEELNPNKVWVIKSPTEECIAAVSALIPGCTLYTSPEHVFQNEVDPVEGENSVQAIYVKSYLFLMSPKAIQKYNLEPVYAETVVITCTAYTMAAASTIDELYQTAFFLFKGLNNDKFTNLSVFVNKTDLPGSGIVRAVKKKLGLRIFATWLSTQGTLVVKNKFNSIISTRNLIHTTVFHLNLRDHQVKHALKVLQAPELRFPILPSTYVNYLSNGHKVMLLLYSDFLDVDFMTDNMTFVQLEIMLRCFNKTLGPLPFFHEMSVNPFLHYSRLPLQYIDLSFLNPRDVEEDSE